MQACRYSQYATVHLDGIETDYLESNSICNEYFNTTLATIRVKQDEYSLFQSMVDRNTSKNQAWIGLNCLNHNYNTKNTNNNVIDNINTTPINTTRDDDDDDENQCSNITNWRWLDGTPVTKSINYIIWSSHETQNFTNFSKVNRIVRHQSNLTTVCLKLRSDDKYLFSQCDQTVQQFSCNWNNISFNKKMECSYNYNDNSHKIDDHYHKIISSHLPTSQIICQFSYCWFVITYLICYVFNNISSDYIAGILLVYATLMEIWLSRWYVFRFSNIEIYTMTTFYILNKSLIVNNVFYVLLCYKRKQLWQQIKMRLPDSDLDGNINSNINQDHNVSQLSSSIGRHLTECKLTIKIENYPEPDPLPVNCIEKPENFSSKSDYNYNTHASTSAVKVVMIMTRMIKMNGNVMI